MNPMKAITIHQPWATLIALGEKQFETRSWATKYRGELAIHAGKKIDLTAIQDPEIYMAILKHGFDKMRDLPLGVVVGVAELKDCFSVRRDFIGGLVMLQSENRRTHFETKLNEFKFGDFSTGRFAWQMSDVHRLPVPVPAKGQQGLWNWKEAKDNEG
jgi:hypothetical protein